MIRSFSEIIYSDKINIYEGQKLTLNAFKNRVFPKEDKQGKELKILTPKKLLKRLPIALAQIKGSNTFKN